MLVLSLRRGDRVRLRKEGQTDIWIMRTLEDDGPGKIRIGIDAPRDVQILREEVLRREESAKT